MKLLDWITGKQQPVTAEVELDEEDCSLDAQDMAYQAGYDDGSDQRKWLASALKVLDANPICFDVNGNRLDDDCPNAAGVDKQMQKRLMLSIDQMRIAAADRVTRILKSDMTEPD